MLVVVLLITGAIAEPVPPVGNVYHKSVLPAVAVADAAKEMVEFTQKFAGDTTVGAVGIVVTVAGPNFTSSK